MAKRIYKLKGTDTTIITYEDADEFRVIGSDEHGFYEALTSEHELGDLAAPPWSDPPLMTTRLPVDWIDYSRVIWLHCLRVGLDESNIEFRREP